jgi:hypothetical protein
MKKKVVLLGFILLAANVALAADALVVFRPSDATWHGSHTQPSPVFLNGLTTTTIGWGWAGIGAPNQVPLIGDVNGDGIDDIVLLQVAGGNYNWVAGHSTVSGGVGSFSSTTTSGFTNFGTAAGSLGSFLADINGDGYEDAVTCNSGGYWYVIYSAASGLGGGTFDGPVQFGLTGDTPFVGDFNGDGNADICVVRNWDGANLMWFVRTTNTSGVFTETGTAVNGFLGFVGDKCMVGDVDGDGRTDAIIARDDNWYDGQLFWQADYAEANGLISWQSGVSSTAMRFGLNYMGDLPNAFVADANGDGKMDVGVRRISNISDSMFWYVKFTSAVGDFINDSITSDVASFGAGSGYVPLIGNLGAAPAVSATNCVYTLFGDYNGDCVVNLTDFAVMAERWAINCIATPSDPECVVPNY